MVLTNNLSPNIISTTSNTDSVIKSTCINIQVHPKPRLNSKCYNITTVVQKCSYEQGVAAGNSDGYLQVFNLTYERYGICARNILFINGYKDGFFKVYNPEFGSKTDAPELEIETIDNEAVIQGVNYDYRSDTFFATQHSTIEFKDTGYISGRAYFTTPDEFVNNTVEDYHDGNFKWDIADTTLQPDDEVVVGVEALDLGMEKSNISELKVVIKEKSDIPDIELSGGRDVINSALVSIDVDILNFTDGFKVYPDGLPIEFDAVPFGSVEYDLLLEQFYENSSTTYHDGSYAIYSETDSLIGEYPFEIPKGNSNVTVEFYTSHIEKLKIVFKIKAREYLKSKSEYGYGVIYLDAVPDSVNNTILGQLSKPFWYALSSIKIQILNYLEGHTYSVYLRMSSVGQVNNYEDLFEVNRLYLSDVKRDSFYIPYDEYQFLELATGQYKYAWIAGVYVFDVTDGSVPDFVYATMYIPQVDFTAIEKTKHWAGVGTPIVSARDLQPYYLRPQTGFGVT